MIHKEQSFFTGRKWAAFKKDRFSVFSFLLILGMCIISFTAEIWANNKPLYMKFNGKHYFPAFKKYHPSEFGAEDDFRSDYRKFALKADSVIWPIIRWSPSETNPEPKIYPSPPTRDNLMGTDDRGRDVLSRIIYGFRYSMLYALCVWIISSITAIIVGGIMGYFAGRLDLVGQRLIEIWETVPVFMILLLLVSIFSPNLFWLVAISCLFGWMGMSRYVRGEFLRLRNLPFVEFARAQGVSHARIIFVHILPNAITPLVTLAPFVIAGGIYGLSELDYLGFGLPPPTPSWGELLAQAKANVTVAWWLAVYPSAALFITLLLLTFLGNGLRKAFDPKAHS